jgi:prevent-host-death family protein
MHAFNIHEAKTNFSKLIDAAMLGEEVIIAKAGKPVVKLTALKETRPKRRFGVLKKKIKIPKNFDEPLPDDIVAEFER